MSESMAPSIKKGDFLIVKSTKDVKEQETKVEETKEVVEEPKENISDTRSHKIIKLAIGLLLVTSVTLLIYAAFEAYALLM